ncbi:MAG TPA: photosystem reaction center subunit H, partial [Methanomicrobia archaeon]|nr:photosystem reaction center subunit H [Methanomicrobia archaeon]HEX59913.1 photosystem reaction center subunit H [Methanomicrobia archaeon]
VYTDTGIYVGKVKDVAIDVKERKIAGLAVEDVNKDLFSVEAKGVIIPHRWILAIGDIILIKHVERLRRRRKEEEERAK